MHSGLICMSWSFPYWSFGHEDGCVGGLVEGEGGKGGGVVDRERERERKRGRESRWVGGYLHCVSSSSLKYLSPPLSLCLSLSLSVSLSLSLSHTHTHMVRVTLFGIQMKLYPASWTLYLPSAPSLSPRTHSTQSAVYSFLCIHIPVICFSFKHRCETISRSESTNTTYQNNPLHVEVKYYWSLMRRIHLKYQNIKSTASVTFMLVDHSTHFPWLKLSWLIKWLSAF